MLGHSKHGNTSNSASTYLKNLIAEQRGNKCIGSRKHKSTCCKSIDFYAMIFACNQHPRKCASQGIHKKSIGIVPPCLTSTIVPMVAPGRLRKPQPPVEWCITRRRIMISPYTIGMWFKNIRGHIRQLTDPYKAERAIVVTGTDGARLRKEMRTPTEVVKERREVFYNPRCTTPPGLGKFPNHPRYWDIAILTKAIALVNQVFPSCTLRRMMGSKGWVSEVHMHHDVNRDPWNMFRANYRIGNVAVHKAHNTAKIDLQGHSTFYPHHLYKCDGWVVHTTCQHALHLLAQVLAHVLWVLSCRDPS